MNTLSPRPGEPVAETNRHGLRQQLHSPEQVALELPVAGPAARMLAYFIDYLVIAALFLTIGMFLILSGLTIDVSAQAAFESLDFESEADTQNFLRSGTFIVILTLALLVQLLIETLYFVFWEVVASGSSVGKRVVGLRVVNDQGMALSFGQSLARNLMRIVDALPSGYLTGLTAIVMSNQGKRLGDLAAGTIVVRLDAHEPAPPVPTEPRPTDEAFRFRADQVARIGGSEMQLARQALRRAEGQTEPRRSDLLRLASDAIRKRVDYEEIADGQAGAFLRAVLREGQRRRAV